MCGVAVWLYKRCMSKVSMEIQFRFNYSNKKKKAKHTWMKRMYKMFQLFLVARVKIKSSLRMQLHCYCVTGWGPRLEGSEIAPYICRRTGGQAGHGADLLFGCEVSQPRALTRFPLSPSLPASSVIWTQGRAKSRRLADWQPGFDFIVTT